MLNSGMPQINYYELGGYLSEKWFYMEMIILAEYLQIGIEEL